MALDRAAELVHEMQKWHFVALELNLFLDTHPANRRALEDYNNAVRRFHELCEQYEREVGPLMNHGFSESPDEWKWIRGPWPINTGM